MAEAKPTPLPGRPVRGSTNGHPLMALFDLLGRRWALTVLWGLREGPATFRELQARTDGIAPSVLNSRLRELRDAQLVVGGERGYELTSQGRQLLAAGEPLSEWALCWAAGLDR
jgi:DNA-binding HxlR family transcriptional regulator